MTWELRQEGREPQVVADPGIAVVGLCFSTGEALHGETTEDGTTVVRRCRDDSEIARIVEIDAPRRSALPALLDLRLFLYCVVVLGVAALLGLLVGL